MKSNGTCRMEYNRTDECVKTRGDSFIGFALEVLLARGEMVVTIHGSKSAVIGD